jgi:hypothetical protein
MQHLQHHFLVENAARIMPMRWSTNVAASSPGSAHVLHLARGLGLPHSHLENELRNLEIKHTAHVRVSPLVGIFAVVVATAGAVLGADRSIGTMSFISTATISPSPSTMSCSSIVSFWVSPGRDIPPILMSVISIASVTGRVAVAAAELTNGTAVDISLAVTRAADNKDTTRVAVESTIRSPADISRVSAVGQPITADAGSGRVLSKCFSIRRLSGRFVLVGEATRGRLMGASTVVVSGATDDDADGDGVSRSNPQGFLRGRRAGEAIVATMGTSTGAKGGAVTEVSVEVAMAVRM